ncbi:hypothetical protein [Yoonia sp. BS5-3]|uniref:Uncharacterized protein n=1 Tax=Yoonia phaeophyticola TaxID=3137369 RepID=A0ABZ2VB26_9RHOB
MKHSLAIAALIISLVPSLAIAQDAFDDATGAYVLAQNRDYTDVIGGLQATNYDIEDVSTTLLGRTMIVANNGLHRREIVVSRATGEILSDVLLDMPIDDDAAALQAAMAAGSEPVPEDDGISFDISGSVTVGINSGSGAYGSGSVSASQDNIGGSGVDATVTYSRGFD